MSDTKQPQPMPAMMQPDIDKSRNVTGGFNMWAQQFPMLNFIMFIFGWFTVPIEVLFRRNFGQRWLTVINFYAGLLVLGAFTVWQTLSSAMGGYSSSHNSHNNSYQNNVPMGAGAHMETVPYDQTPAGPSFWDSFMDKSMFFFLLLYLAFSSYHFFRIWWRNRTNTLLHSFEDGKSWFEPIAALLMMFVNIIAIPVIRLYMLLLPKKERERSQSVPPLIDDITAFTNTVFEPLLLLILAFIFHGTTRTWLLISAPALAVYANFKETAKLNKMLDFMDTVI